MPLTRHLYKEDEVAAALMLSCLRGRVEDAAFWGLELLDSGMADELLLALRRIWLWGFAGSETVAAGEWILGFEEAVKGEALEADMLLGCAVDLARLGAARRQDISVAVLMALTWRWQGCSSSTPQPDRVNKVGGHLQESSLEEFLTAALRQGKTVTAWTAFRGLAGESCDGGWDLLKRGGCQGGGALLDCLAAMEDVELLPRQAAAVAAICLGARRKGLPQAATGCRPLEERLAAKIAAWRDLHGRRNRRALSMPFEALPWLTQRGRCVTVYDSNEKELFRLERPAALWGSQIWDELAEEVGGWEAIRQGTERSDAAAREAFYERHFPDDIPDEWSRADRAKSHGSGVLQRGAQPDAARWFRTWFGLYSSSVIWEGVRAALAALEAARPTEASALWRGAEETPKLETWNFAPVTKRIFVVG